MLNWEIIFKEIILFTTITLRVRKNIYIILVKKLTSPFKNQKLNSTHEQRKYYFKKKILIFIYHDLISRLVMNVKLDGA